MARALVRLGAVSILIGLVGAGVSLVPDLLSRMTAFQVHGVRIDGARYLDTEWALASVHLPSGASVWDDASPWLESLRAHPLVVSAQVRRRLPDSLVIRVEERQPVALVATPTLEPVDADGRALPIDPSRHPLDLPILRIDGLSASGEVNSLKIRPLARELARLQRMDPSFSEMVWELGWQDGEDVVALWGDPAVSIRFRPPLAAAILQAARSAIAHATAHYPERRLQSVDLRYADQVVVRF